MFMSFFSCNELTRFLNNRVSAWILFEGTPGRGTPGGFGGYPPKARKKLNSKVSETIF